MNLDGSAVLHGTPEEVWTVITDPAVLARTIPGCESLQRTGEDEYRLDVAVGVGGALYERMAYDADGQLQNASFMDFLMPYASEVPDIAIDHQETPSPLNPLGIKGAGEAGVIPGTAAIASAIEDATGRRITSMPISPSELFGLRQEHAAGRLPSLRHRHVDGDR